MEEQKWGDSFAKAYLKKSLLDDKSKIHSMTPAEVYLSHPSFACYPKDRFIANLANLKEALRIERERVAQEEKEFLREQSLYPRGKVTSRGKPFSPSIRESSHSTSSNRDSDMGGREQMTSLIFTALALRPSVSSCNTTWIVGTQVFDL